MLTFRRIYPGASSVDNVKNLFLTAFTEDERPPFEIALAWERTCFEEVSEDGEFIGLRMTLEKDDIAYLFFLAIDPKKRNKGYGSQVVDDFVRAHPSQRLYLLADEYEPSYKDADIRARRLGFYQRHGFIRTGIIINEYGVRYEVLCQNGQVSNQDHIDMMEYLLDKEYFRVYLQNVS